MAAPQSEPAVQFKVPAKTIGRPLDNDVMSRRGLEHDASQQTCVPVAQSQIRLQVDGCPIQLHAAARLERAVAEGDLNTPRGDLRLSLQ